MRGILAPNVDRAEKYREAMKESPVQFSSQIQRAIIASILGSQEKQDFDAHFIATDPTHVHLLVSWRDDRTWLRLRSTIKSSLSRYLNSRLTRREWFVEGGSRKRVKDRAHFDYLVQRYLPRHSGWKWSPEKGVYK
jgi:hypothetical protein